MDDQHTTGTSGRKRFRKLRIAWSVGWGILCLLLIVLWMRSYWRLEAIHVSRNSFSSMRGIAGWTYWTEGTPATRFGWGSASLDDMRKSGRFTTQRARGFRLQRTPDGFTLILPHWSLLVVALVISAAPWLRWRFSLRTLLIITTLVAVGLGWIVYALRN